MATAFCFIPYRYQGVNRLMFNPTPMNGTSAFQKNLLENNKKFICKAPTNSQSIQLVKYFPSRLVRRV